MPVKPRMPANQCEMDAAFALLEMQSSNPQTRTAYDARRTWLLVEWMDEGSNVFANYGVVNANFLYNKTEINPGKVIYVPMKHGSGARRAQILKISGSKRQMKEYKLFLQRKDHQVKNVVSVCMRSIPEMKTNPLMFFESPGQRPLIGDSSILNAGNVSEDTSDSSSDGEDSKVKLEDRATLRTQLQPTVNQNPAIRLLKVSTAGHRNMSPVQSRRTMSSAPLPRTLDVKRIFDQGTQTDNNGDHPSLAKLDEMENKLKATYTQFLRLTEQLNALQPNDPREHLLAESDIDHTPTEDDTEESDRDQNIVGEAQHLDNSNVEIEPNVNGHSAGPRTLHVRRVSAHTTNVVETSNVGLYADMVPIGSGSTTVPARLINVINWNSYSTATRQLLQAVFPRRILATHSLSGKQSPAFANKPPKKQLDSNIVEDIVDTVSGRCGVPKRLVRASITNKCTDEAKLYRNRQYRYAHAHQANHTLKVGRGDVAPSPVSSESFHPTD